MSRTQVENIGISLLAALHHWGQTEIPSAFGDVYERSWSEELTTVLCDQGLTATHQVAYPGSRQTCDLVCQLRDGSEIWIEVKGAWSVIASGVGTSSPSYKRNPNFRKHLFNAEESALRDTTAKLPSVRSASRHTALLLIGFDLTDKPMDAHIAELTQQAGLAVPQWSLLHREWANPHDSRHRTRCWFWYSLGV